MLQTYGARYSNGFKTYGGFASHWRGPSKWVFAIPEGMSPAEAAPMLCGGITLYAPLKRFGAGPGKNVGIVGAGGLGHFGILFAKALGADKVFALSRGTAKKDDMLKLGATDYISTDEEADWATKYASTLDIIICTVSSPEIPLDGYLSLLRTNGAFVQLGAPALPPVNMFSLIFKGLTISGSLIGSPGDIREMLDFAVAKGVHPMIQERSMKDANKVVEDLDKGLARYRYVLVN
jgi:alcohol dehydrogenase (NADP+)